MKLAEYLKAERGNAKKLAIKIGAYTPDIYRWALPKTDKNHRKIPFEYGPRIEKATDGLVSRKDNFDHWDELWPELAEKNQP